VEKLQGRAEQREHGHPELQRAVAETQELYKSELAKLRDRSDAKQIQHLGDKLGEMEGRFEERFTDLEERLTDPEISDRAKLNKTWGLAHKYDCFGLCTIIPVEKVKD